MLNDEMGRLFRLKATIRRFFPPAQDTAAFGSDDGLKVISAYPPGQAHLDMKRKGRAGPKLPLPPTDPFYGGTGPLDGSSLNTYPIAVSSILYFPAEDNRVGIDLFKVEMDAIDQLLFAGDANSAKHAACHLAEHGFYDV